MSIKSRDLSKFIVNYWMRKENKEILTLNQLHQKEREQLARIQRRRRNDLKYWFELEIPERELSLEVKGLSVDQHIASNQKQRGKNFTNQNGNVYIKTEKKDFGSLY